MYGTCIPTSSWYVHGILTIESRMRNFLCHASDALRCEFSIFKVLNWRGIFLCVRVTVRFWVYIIYPSFRPIRRTFFPEKCDLHSTGLLYAEGKYYFQTYKYPYFYYTTSLSCDGEISSKSWDLASLLVNGLLSYPGIYPNVYIASRVNPGIYAAAVAKCSQV